MRQSWMRTTLMAAACAAMCMSATSASAIGLIQAYEAALKNDPQYQSAVFENQAGQEYRKLGRSGLLPSVQYSYSTSKNKAAQTAPNFLGQLTTSYPEYTSINNSVSLRQTLFSLDATARYKQGIAQTKYSDAQFSGRAQDLMVRVLSAYADAKYAEDQLALYTAQRDSYREQKHLNARLFEKGEGTRTDMLETEAKLDVAEAQVIESTDNLAAARNTLAAMIGMEVNNLDSLGSEFKVMPFSPSTLSEWRLIASDQNAEIAAARLAIEASEQEINKNRAGHTPRLDLNASYSRSIADTLTNYNQDSTVRSIGVQLVIPIYSGGYVSASTSQAVANRDKARSDLEATTNKVMIELQRQFNTTQSSMAKIDALQKSVNSATLLVQATKQSVKGGVRINLDVLNAEQQLVASKRDLAQARYNYLISLIKLRVAAGNLSIDDLRSVAAYFSNSN